MCDFIACSAFGSKVASSDLPASSINAASGTLGRTARIPPTSTTKPATLIPKRPSRALATEPTAPLAAGQIGIYRLFGNGQAGREAVDDGRQLWTMGFAGGEIAQHCSSFILSKCQGD